MNECNLCHVKFSDSSHLTRHKSGRCKAAKGYTLSCRDCNKLFKTKATLHAHACKNKKIRLIKIRIKLTLKEIARIRFETTGADFSEWSAEEKRYVLEKVFESTEELIEEVIKEIFEEVVKELEDLTLC